MSSFSNLTAQSAVIGSLNISNVSGTGIAQAVEAIGGVVNYKVITPSGLRAFAQNALGERQPRVYRTGRHNIRIQKAV